MQERVTLLQRLRVQSGCIVCLVSIAQCTAATWRSLTHFPYPVWAWIDVHMTDLSHGLSAEWLPAGIDVCGEGMDRDWSLDSLLVMFQWTHAHNVSRVYCLSVAPDKHRWHCFITENRPPAVHDSRNSTQKYSQEHTVHHSSGGIGSVVAKHQCIGGISKKFCDHNNTTDFY